MLVDPLGNSAMGARGNSAIVQHDVVVDAWRESRGAVPSRARRKTAQWNASVSPGFPSPSELRGRDTQQLRILLRLSVLDRTAEKYGVLSAVLHVAVEKNIVLTVV